MNDFFSETITNTEIILNTLNYISITNALRRILQKVQVQRLQLLNTEISLHVANSFAWKTNHVFIVLTCACVLRVTA